jgi:hypothetical protein
VGCVCAADLRVLMMGGGLRLEWSIDVLLASVLVVKPCIRSSVTLHSHSMSTFVSSAMFFGPDRRFFFHAKPSLHIPSSNPNLHIPSIILSKILLTIVVIALVNFIRRSLALALY